MKGLNLAGWMKVAEDKKSTTLKHEKGHTMTLAHAKLPRIQCEALKRLKMAEGGDVESEKTPPPVTVNVGQPAISQPVQAAQPVPVNVPQVPKTQNVLLPNGSMNAPASAQTAQEGAKLGAQIQAAKSSAAVPQEQQYLEQTAKYNQDFANNLNEVKQKADDFSEFNTKHPLRENAYLEDASAGRKIGTALGLIFSGAGSGVTGQPNMAYDFLNKQIDRNIQAQKDRFGQAHTVWGAYNDLYHNETVANNMARVHALDMLEHQGRLTAAQLGTPSAAAGLLDLQSKIAPERNKLILDSAGAMSSIPQNVPHGHRDSSPSGSVIYDPRAPINANYRPTPNISGPQQSEASVDPKEIDRDPYADSGILAPDAQQKLDQLRYTPKAKDEIDQIKSQYSAAQQADVLLSQLHNVHQNMYKQAVQGGSAGYLRRHDPSRAVPYVGEALSGMAVGPMTATNNNKLYDSNRTRLIGDIASALRGTNISGGEIDKIVNDNQPEPGDSPELIESKERNIRLFIKNNVNKSLLKDWNLAK